MSMTISSSLLWDAQEQPADEKDQLQDFCRGGGGGGGAAKDSVSLLHVLCQCFGSTFKSHGVWWPVSKLIDIARSSADSPTGKRGQGCIQDFQGSQGSQKRPTQPA